MLCTGWGGQASPPPGRPHHEGDRHPGRPAAPFAVGPTAGVVNLNFLDFNSCFIFLNLSRNISLNLKFRKSLKNIHPKPQRLIQLLQFIFKSSISKSTVEGTSASQHIKRTGLTRWRKQWISPKKEGFYAGNEQWEWVMVEIWFVVWFDLIEPNQVLIILRWRKQWQRRLAEKPKMVLKLNL